MKWQQTLSNRPVGTIHMQEVSVIVLTKNSEKLLDDCLKSIVKNEPSEIIIIDDGSTDRTLEICKQYTDQIYHNGKGIAFGRQLGAEKANKEYIAYVDSDVILPENFFGRMLIEKKEKGYHAIQAQTLSMKNGTYWQLCADKIQESDNVPREQGWVGTTATIFDRDIVLKYKFDPLIPSSEDGELSFRLKKAGYKLGRGSVRVLHLHRQNFKGWKKQRIWRGKGKAQFIYKYKFTFQSARTFVNPALVAVCSPLLALKHGQPRLFPYILLDGIFQEIGLLQELAGLLIKGKHTIGY